MKKKLTITIDEEIYAGLYENVGKRNISSFNEDLFQPHFQWTDLDKANQEMAKYEASVGSDTLMWPESLIQDHTDEER